MMKGKARFLVVVIALGMIAVACSSGGNEGDSGGTGGTSSGSGSSGPAVQGGSFSFANCEPNPGLNPLNDYESCGAQVFNVMWDRLMEYDPDTNAPVPFQAESVTSDDNTLWTIKIKSGWTFHNGEPVTAQSYVDAWNWAALGSNGAILNFLFSRIDGYDDLNPSKGDAKTTEMSGLKAIDDTTFTVQLTSPFSQFPVQLGFDGFDPLPKVFFDDPDGFAANPIGDGPYQLDEWKHDEVITLARYDDYAGTPGNADEIRLTEYSSADASWADFQAGNVDISLVGSSNLLDAQQNYPDTFQQQPSSTLLYLGLPLYQPEYQNKLLRQALSLAVNREAVMNAVLIAEQPATAFAPPVVPGFREASCKYCTYDVELAKQKFDEAGGFQGTMVINLYSDDSTLEQAMEAIGNQWKQNLGIDFELNPINSNAYYDTGVSHKYEGPWWDGWVMDYPSLEDYLRPIYGTKGGYNLTGYSNPTFDDLLEQGDRADSIEDSISIYQQAEDIIDEDMPAIPWGYLPLGIVNQTTVTNVHKAGPLDNLELRDVQVVQ
jgi:oligopeptide transport system substrate-binding protein